MQFHHVHRARRYVLEGIVESRYSYHTTGEGQMSREVLGEVFRIKRVAIDMGGHLHVLGPQVHGMLKVDTQYTCSSLTRGTESFYRLVLRASIF